MLLVTGAAGFIGSNVLARLNEAGETDVAICDTIGTAGKWRNLAKHEFADLVPLDSLKGWLASAPRLDAVIHLGAHSDTMASDGDELMDRNFACSLTLWRYCTLKTIPYIYASSAATYGDGKAGFLDSDHPDFLSSLRPLSLYGWSKHVFDRYVARMETEGQPTPPRWYGLKLFNVFGPNEYHKGHMSSGVYNITSMVRQGKPARLFASDRLEYVNGRHGRDFVFVDDICNIILWLLRSFPRSGLYNVGSGRARSWTELAHAVFTVLGKEPRIEFVPMPEQLRGKYQYWTEADMTKLRQVGYDAPLASLESGIAKYINEYLVKDDPYR